MQYKCSWNDSPVVFFFLKIQQIDRLGLKHIYSTVANWSAFLERFITPARRQPAVLKGRNAPWVRSRSPWLCHGATFLDSENNCNSLDKWQKTKNSFFLIQSTGIRIIAYVLIYRLTWVKVGGRERLWKAGTKRVTLIYASKGTGHDKFVRRGSTLSGVGDYRRHHLSHEKIESAKARWFRFFCIHRINHVNATFVNCASFKTTFF